ncbi:golgin subfamily B member 1-like [Physella acuta]|uniref:golgin subfamily B member 1-like n=1 Tax=Physella acuta TaxID=109671 RepID=UPI0027DE7F1B|nr:golgin subfamily B member 1-like [Physella acuta]
MVKIKKISAVGLAIFACLTTWYGGVLIYVATAVLAAGLGYYISVKKVSGQVGAEGTSTSGIRDVDEVDLARPESCSDNKIKFSHEASSTIREGNDVTSTDQTRGGHVSSSPDKDDSLIRPSPEGLETMVRRASDSSMPDDTSGIHSDVSSNGGDDVSLENDGEESVPNPQTQPVINRQEIDLLLIGKTGHGKSATGNSIARRKAFNTSSGASSDTYDVQELWTDIEDFTVHVVDGPGVGETRLDDVEATEKACSDMAKAMTKCPNGFHALLLVLKFGGRFTKEEQESIVLLKKIFGENIVRDYCIIVMTHGDSFDLNQEDLKVESFSEWLSQQPGALKHLLIECSYRCILFRNRTREEKEKRDQVIDLLQMVRKLKHRDVRYTNSLFDEFKKDRDRLIVEAKAPQIKVEIMKETNLIIEAMGRLKISDESMDEIDPEISSIDEKIEKMIDVIKTEDQETGALNYLTEEITKLKSNLTEIKEFKQRKRDDLMKRKLLDQEHQIKMEEMKRKQAEEANMYLEKLRNASEEEKSVILQKMQDNEIAAKEREERIIKEFNEKMQKSKEEDDRRWQENIKTLQKTHDKQMVTLQQHYTDMARMNETAMQEQIRELTEKLEEIQENARPPKKDPNKIDIKCVDQQHKCINVELDKYDQMVLLMRAYCDKYGYQMNTLKFMYDGNRVLEDDTPSKLGLEDGDAIDVFSMQVGGITRKIRTNQMSYIPLI